MATSVEAKQKGEKTRLIASRCDGFGDPAGLPFVRDSEVGTSIAEAARQSGGIVGEVSEQKLPRTVAAELSNVRHFVGDESDRQTVLSDEELRADVDVVSEGDAARLRAQSQIGEGGFRISNFEDRREASDEAARVGCGLAGVGRSDAGLDECRNHGGFFFVGEIPFHSIRSIDVGAVSSRRGAARRTREQ